MATEESKKKWIRLSASPRGKRCGLAVFSQGERSIQLLVLPKRWSKEKREWYSSDLAKKKRISLVLHETDSIDLDISENPEWEPLFENFRMEMQDKVENKRNETKTDSAKSETDNDPEDDAFEGLKELSQLLVIRSGKSRKKGDSVKEWTEEQTRKSKERFNQKLGELLQLSLVSNEFHSKNRKDKISDQAQGYMIGLPNPDQQDAEPLKLLAQYAFLGEMERLWRRLRQGYVSTTETLGFVRGRITPRGMVRHMASGLPAIECTHDRFTDAIPLFRVLVTALQVVAGGSLLHSLMGDASSNIFSKLTARASNLRRHLGHIPGYHRGTANHQVRHLRLNRLESDWQQALDLARVILLAEPLELKGRTQGNRGIMWWVNTDKVWEGILESMLRSASVNVPESQKRVQPPWKHVGGSKPIDLVLTYQDQTVVADAKYKDASKTPSSEDQYQIFAYSLLYEIPPTRAALIYPYTKADGVVSEIDSEKTKTRAPLNVLDEANPMAIPLHRIEVPYPQPENLNRFDEYLQTNGEALRDILFPKAEAQDQSNTPMPGRQTG